MRTLQLGNIDDGSGKFLLSPVPLNGVYRVVAWRDAQFAMSDNVLVDSQHPLREMDLRFTTGISVTQTILAPDGSPMRDVPRHFLFRPPGTNSSFGVAGQTDQQGRTHFTNVNVNAESYALDIPPTPTTQRKYLALPSIGSSLPPIRLAAGLTARAHFTDSATGKPIIHKNVHLYAANFSLAAYPNGVDAQTDENGYVEFRSLEPIKYNINVNDTYPIGAQLIKDSTGRITSVISSNEDTLIAGDPTTREIKRITSR